MIDDYHSSYRSKDQLNHHLLQHQGSYTNVQLINNCKIEFAFRGNMMRYVVEFHSEDCHFD
jgi:hypothetical protein